MLDLSGVYPPLMPLNPQVFIDPHWFSQKYIADPPLVLPQMEYWDYSLFFRLDPCEIGGQSSFLILVDRKQKIESKRQCYNRIVL